MMVTVWREAGFRVVIFSNDHEPAHVHVFGDGQIKIDLAVFSDSPALIWAEGMTRGDVRRALQIVSEQRDHLIQRWNDIHG